MKELSKEAFIKWLETAQGPFYRAHISDCPLACYFNDGDKIGRYVVTGDEVVDLASKNRIMLPRWMHLFVLRWDGQGGTGSTGTPSEAKLILSRIDARD